MNENARIKLISVFVALFFVAKDAGGIVLYAQNHKLIEKEKLIIWKKLIENYVGFKKDD